MFMKAHSHRNDRNELNGNELAVLSSLLLSRPCERALMAIYGVKHKSHFAIT